MKLTTWFKRHLKKIPHSVIAMNFNLYESCLENQFYAELVGCVSYDHENPDWACNTVFSTDDKYYWFKGFDWEEALNNFVSDIQNYMISENDPDLTLGGQIEYITAGFVDGDLELIYKKGQEIVPRAKIKKRAQVQRNSTIDCFKLKENEDGTYTLLGLDRNVRKVVVPENVTIIEKRAFGNAKYLKSVLLPEILTHIGDHAFQNSGLNSVNIPKNIRYIGEGAFGSTQITSVELPDSISVISPYMFAHCSNLKSLILPSGLVGIDKYAFEGTRIENIVLPKSVKFIGDAAFAQGLGLINITLSNELNSIEPYAFVQCYNLKEIVLPSKLASIGYFAFGFCQSLKSVRIPKSVTEMGEKVFFECINLTDIYCEALNKPEGWNDNWLLNCNATVHWGC